MSKKNFLNFRRNPTFRRKFFIFSLFAESPLIFLIEDTENNVFGCYINSKIDKYRYVENDIAKGVEDPNCFVFSYKDNKPNKYELRKDRKDNSIFMLYDKNDFRLFLLGERDIFIRKSNWKSSCIDDINECKFDYQGKQKVINGKSGSNEENFFEVKRILVIQMT